MRKTDTTIVELHDSLTNIKNAQQQIILIQDKTKKEEKTIFLHPVFVSVLYPLITAILTVLVLKFINRYRGKLEEKEIEARIKSAEQALKDEGVRIGILQKEYEQNVQKSIQDNINEGSKIKLMQKEQEIKMLELEKTINLEYDRIIEDRNKHGLEILKFKQEQINELKLTFIGVSEILTKIETDFSLVQPFKIDSDDYKTHCADYIIKHHHNIVTELRRIQSNSLFLHSQLDSHFETVISGIKILMNRINLDKEKGIDTEDQSYSWRHGEQADSIMQDLKTIISEIRIITKPLTEL